MASNDKQAAADAAGDPAAPPPAPDRLAADVAAAETAALNSRVFELEATNGRLADEVELGKRRVAEFERKLAALTPPPKGVRFAAPYGFIHNGERHHWNPGDVVTNEDEIAALRARGAPLETF